MGISCFSLIKDNQYFPSVGKAHPSFSLQTFHPDPKHSQFSVPWFALILFHEQGVAARPLRVTVLASFFPCTGSLCAKHNCASSSTQPAYHYNWVGTQTWWFICMLFMDASSLAQAKAMGTAKPKICHSLAPYSESSVSSGATCIFISWWWLADLHLHHIYKTDRKSQGKELWQSKWH